MLGASSDPRPSIRLVRLSAIAAGLTALVCATPARSGEPLNIQGSTTFNSMLMEPHRHSIESLAGARLEVIPNKSVNGLIALLEARSHLAMISAPLESELEVVRKARPDLNGDELRSHEVSRTRIAFAVHPSNPVRSVSLDAIRRIMLGQVTKWSELGGPDRPIRLVLVREGGGVTATVQSFLLAGRPITSPGMIRLDTPRQVISVVAQEHDALGFAQLGLVRSSKLAELATEGPVEQQLSIVTRGQPTPVMRAVIEAARKVAADHLY